MPNAYATRGGTGHQLWHGMDVGGRGFQIDKSCLYNSALHQNKADKMQWLNMCIFNLVNSENNALQKFADMILHDGHTTDEWIRYNKCKSVYFIILEDDTKYRVSNKKIVKVKGF